MKLLGAGSRTVETLDRLTGGLLLAATGVNGELVLSLFDAKGELAGLSRELSTAVGDRSRGLGRYRRTQRIAAAHAVIVVTAFFEAVRHGEHHFGKEGLRLLKSEQVLLAGGTGTDGSRLGELTEQLLRADLPCPTRYLHFLCGYEEDILLHAVEPLSVDLDRSLTTFAGYWPDRAASPASSLLRVWLLSSRGDDPAELARAYADCFWVSQGFAPFAEEDALRYLDTVLGHLTLDADRLRGVLTLENLHLADNKPRIVMRIRTAMSELGLT